MDTPIKGLTQLSSNASSSARQGYTPNEVVEEAIKRAQNLILTEGFIPWKLFPRNAEFEPSTNASKNYITSVNISQLPSQTNTSQASDSLDDESYSLTIEENGAVSISSPSHIGIVRALDTLTQLFYQHSTPGAGVYTNLVPVNIKDRPVFEHRGVNYDLSRNWYPVSEILRTIDAVAWNKFSHLHLHVSDAQSWTLDVPALPELAAEGAYRRGLSYSPDELDQILSYGAMRGLEVFLETDMPAHTASIGNAYPELIAALNIQPDWATYASQPPSGSLKLNSTAVENFVTTLLGDVLPRVRPYSRFYHTGADDINPNVWLLDEGVRSNDSAVIQSLLQRFVDHTHGVVRQHGMTPIVWEETLLDWNLTLGKDVVVQTWRTVEAAKEVVARGHRVIAGNNKYWASTFFSPTPFPTTLSPIRLSTQFGWIPHPQPKQKLTTSQFLDCGQGNHLYPRPNSTKHSFQDYCSPFQPWPQMYVFDPTINLDDPAERALLVGAEVNMWSELTDPGNLDSKMWPRASAVAEVLWRGPTGNDTVALLDAATRLEEWRGRMVQRGVRAAPVQMTWCALAGEENCTM